MPARITAEHLDQVSQFLRLGLGLMLLVAGWNLFSLSLDNQVTVVEFWDAVIVPAGMQEFLSSLLFGKPDDVIFTPLNVLTVWGGLTIAGGAFLLLGLFVRLFSLFFIIVYVLPWLIALIEAVAAISDGGSIELLSGTLETAREIGIALLFLVLFNIGPGSNSLDFRLGLPGTVPPGVSWDAVAFQTRLSLLVVFLAAGLAEVLFTNQFYGPPWQLLLLLSVFVAFSLFSRVTGAIALFTIIWHIYLILKGTAGSTMALDIVAPEAPFVAAAVIFMLAGGGGIMRPRIKLTKTLWGRSD